jgi:hypothetical protein
MCAMDKEKRLFTCFSTALPNFADEAIAEWDVVEEWYDKRRLPVPPTPYDNRPDIICLTTTGRRIGLELKSWLNEDQIAEAKKHERIEDNLRQAIGQQPENTTQNIDYIWLFPIEVRFNVGDADEFRKQLFIIIEEVDKGWVTKDKWEKEHMDRVSDFRAFPILAKYLSYIEFHPARRSHRKVRWITFPARARAYKPRDMRETLAQALLSHRADKRYEHLAQKTDIDQVYLLVHYDFNAFVYNNPFDEPGFGFREAADFARQALGGDTGFFCRIFLLNALDGEEEAYRIA